MQIPFLPAEFSSRRPRRPDRRTQRPVGCADEIIFTWSWSITKFPQPVKAKGEKIGQNDRPGSSSFIRGSFDEFRSGLKLSAASCGESSILKRNKASIYACLPRSKLRGMARWRIQVSLRRGPVSLNQIAFSGISGYDSNLLSLTSISPAMISTWGYAGYYRETTTSVR